MKPVPTPGQGLGTTAGLVHVAEVEQRHSPAAKAAAELDEELGFVHALPGTGRNAFGVQLPPPGLIGVVKVPITIPADQSAKQREFETDLEIDLGVYDIAARTTHDSSGCRGSAATGNSICAA